jgi:hypothetical protein
MARFSGEQRSISLWVASVLIGCCAAAVVLVWRGQSLPAKFAVQGQVTLDGKLLDQAVIEFIPLAPLMVKKTGGEIKAGKYQIENEHGLLTGHYRVEIIPYLSPFREPDRANQRNAPDKLKTILVSIPDCYNRQSVLTVEATEENNRFDFSLSSSSKSTVAASAGKPGL